jgi:hypothetical protein
VVIIVPVPASQYRLYAIIDEKPSLVGDYHYSVIEVAVTITLIKLTGVVVG